MKNLIVLLFCVLFAGCAVVETPTPPAPVKTEIIKIVTEVIPKTYEFFGKSSDYLLQIEKSDFGSEVRIWSHFGGSVGKQAMATLIQIRRDVSVTIVNKCFSACTMLFVLENKLTWKCTAVFGFHAVTNQTTKLINVESTETFNNVYPIKLQQYLASTQALERTSLTQINGSVMSLITGKHCLN